MTDEGLHEIHMNGKQLVFLFMAATVVAVVIFLCGVMVGRGVRTSAVQQQAELSAEAAVDPTAERRPVGGTGDEDASSASADMSPSVATEEDLSYPDRLAEPSGSPEAPTEATTSSSSRRPAREGQAPVTASAPDARLSQGNAFTVQVAAVKERREADTIAGRLTRKGYAAYVIAPAAGAPTVYRVRVGQFSERREAESIAAQLEREEQFKPWITR